MRAALPLLLLALAAGPAFAKGEKPVVGRGSAKEGDILLVGGKEVRLWGIDAPDQGQKCQNVRGREYDCFELSRRILDRVVGQETVSCEIRPSGGRVTLGTCKAGGRDVAAVMVATGYALAYRQIAPDYLREESVAMSYRRGLWAGRVEPPWLWRSRQVEEKLDQRKGTSGPAQ